MSKREEGVSRREFVQRAALAAAGAALASTGAVAQGNPGKPAAPPPPASAAERPARAKVVLVRDKAAVGADGAVNAAVVGRMLDDAVCALTGAGKPADAWARYFGPKDVAGIKTNVWKFLATPPELEGALRQRVAACGVQGSLPVTDRGARAELIPCNALLNVRPVRTHHWAGVGGCLKNYIMFVEQPSDYHPDSCANLGAIWNLPSVKGKTRLNVLVALTPQFYGRGPHAFDPRNVWTYGGLFVSTDPVAVDALGAELLRLKRLEFFGEDKPITPWTHIALADTKHGIGVADPKRIDLVRIGWEEKVLL
jgi:hypothetical protein